MNIKLILEIDGHQYELDRDDTRFDFVIAKTERGEDVQVVHISSEGNQIGFEIKRNAKEANDESAK